MKLRKILLIFSIFFILPLTGCLPKATSVVVPTSDITVEQATEINLKILDLTKMTTTDTEQVLSYPLENIEGAKVIEYRYPVKPIKVTVAKFETEKDATQFLSGWAKFVSEEHKINMALTKENEKDFWEFSTVNNKIIAWQEGLWFSYIEVPTELKNSEDLSYKVKDVIILHFESLNKGTKI